MKALPSSVPVGRVKARCSRSWGRSTHRPAAPCGSGESTLRSWTNRGLAQFRADKIGFIFQEHHLLPQCTVLGECVGTAAGQGGSWHGGRRAGRTTAGACQLSRPPDAPPGGTIRRRTATGRHRPGTDSPAPFGACRRADGGPRLATADRVADLLLELQSEQETLLITVTHKESLAQRMDCYKRLTDGRFVDTPTSTAKISDD